MLKSLPKRVMVEVLKAAKLFVQSHTPVLAAEYGEEDSEDEEDDEAMDEEKVRSSCTFVYPCYFSHLHVVFFFFSIILNRRRTSPILILTPIPGPSPIPSPVSITMATMMKTKT